jgi:hypothetical protein
VCVRRLMFLDMRLARFLVSCTKLVSIGQFIRWIRPCPRVGRGNAWATGSACLIGSVGNLGNPLVSTINSIMTELSSQA